MPGAARLYARHDFRPWVYRNEQSSVSLALRSSQSLRWKAWNTLLCVSMWTCRSCLCCSEQVWSTESSLAREEGQEFGQGMVGIACRCSLMSGTSAGMVWKLRLESSGDFFTHPAGAWNALVPGLSSLLTEAPTCGLSMWFSLTEQGSPIPRGNIPRVTISGELSRRCMDFFFFDPELEIT